jgi:hypothetical protein
MLDDHLQFRAAPILQNAPVKCEFDLPYLFTSTLLEAARRLKEPSRIEPKF